MSIQELEEQIRQLKLKYDEHISYAEGLSEYYQILHCETCDNITGYTDGCETTEDKKWRRCQSCGNCICPSCLLNDNDWCFKQQDPTCNEC